jgi:hypothetical protein
MSSVSDKIVCLNSDMSKLLLLTWLPSCKHTITTLLSILYTCYPIIIHVRIVGVIATPSRLPRVVVADLAVSPLTPRILRKRLTMILRQKERTRVGDESLVGIPPLQDRRHFRLLQFSVLGDRLAQAVQEVGLSLVARLGDGDLGPRIRHQPTIRQFWDAEFLDVGQSRLGFLDVEGVGAHVVFGGFGASPRLHYHRQQILQQP